MADYIIHNGELMHYGVKGMKWGHRKNRFTSAISGRIKKNTVASTERFKDKLASTDPISKNFRERIKENQKRQAERLDIAKSKGAAKTAKILKKIGNDLLNSTVVVDGPKGPQRQPWDEKPHRDRGGHI